MKINRRDALKQLGVGAAGLAAASVLARLPDVDASDVPSIFTKPIPRTKETIPVIGLGTWATFDVGSSPEERKPLEEVLAEFSRLGGTVIDSSPKYGQSETVAGDLSEKLGV